VKALQDEVRRQAAALQEWNVKLEERVGEQVAELDRLGQLKHFFSPNVAEAITSASEKSILAPHRREIAYVFVDLRGFTAFTDGAEPEEVEAVLRKFHNAMGALVTHYEGTIDRFAGDGILIFFNDPLPMADPGLRAARMALEMQACFVPLRAEWLKRGFDLDLGSASRRASTLAPSASRALGYSAIGSVVNLAARLAIEAKGAQILIDRACARRSMMPRRPPGRPASLEGFDKPVDALLVRLQS
jgi:class 3 adenylate cyclase